MYTQRDHFKPRIGSVFLIIPYFQEYAAKCDEAAPHYRDSNTLTLLDADIQTKYYRDLSLAGTLGTDNWHKGIRRARRSFLKCVCAVRLQ